MAIEYELIYIMPPDLDQAAIDALNEQVSQYIQQFGGAVDNIRTSDLRQLAYEIKGYTEGIYAVIKLHCETSAVSRLDRELTLNQQIIRHMIIRVDE